MCDYSLHGLKNRLATEGEQLCVYKFHTGSKGLAPVDEVQQVRRTAETGGNWWERLKAFFTDDSIVAIGQGRKDVCAVCIPPGARLELQGLPAHLQKEFGVSACERVTFVQLSAEAFRYRDGVRFANGRELLLQRLNEGLQVTVRQLALAEETVPERTLPSRTARAGALVG
jgi:hypothetical protein